MSNLIKLGYKNPDLQNINNAVLLLTKNKHNNSPVFHENFANLSYDIKYYLVFNSLKTSISPYLNEIYAATIVTSILHNGFDSWAHYNVHLDYDTIFRNIYSHTTCIWTKPDLDNLDTVNLGNKLLSHQFIKPAEYAQLQHFRSIQRESKVCPTDIYQLLMSI